MGPGCALLSVGPGLLRPVNLDCLAANFLAHARVVLAEEITRAVTRCRQRWTEALEQGSAREEVVRERLAVLAAEETQMQRLLERDVPLGSFDLVDATGERKGLGSRLDQRVSTFVAGDRLFFLARVADRADPKSALQPVYLAPAALLAPGEAVPAALPRAVELLRGRGRVRP